MRLLLDTNILLRLSQSDHPHHEVVVAASEALIAADAELVISSQTIYEFLAVATRLKEHHGLEMAHDRAVATIDAMREQLEVVYDSAEVASELCRIVVGQRVTGKKVHDARLVAAMRVRGIDGLLTLNSWDFSSERFPEDVALDPLVLPPDVIVERLRERAALRP